MLILSLISMLLPLEMKLLICSIMTTKLLPVFLESSNHMNFYTWGDLMSLSLSLMSVMVTFMAIVAWGEKMILMKSNFLGLLMNSLLFILLFLFLTPKMISFYVFFELSLIPIMIMILGWGSQPERLKASLFLMLYTVTASLPLLFIILKLESLNSFSTLSLLVSFERLALENWWNLILFLGFLVKFPLYGTHLWLPKAHVEAPVSGSMILAAILLKLGGYGILRFNTLSVTSNIVMNIQIFSLIGGSLVGILCLTQKDFKLLIAYSSVSHMSMVIFAALQKSDIGLILSVFMMIAHGYASSGMFAMANLSYERTHSRNMFVQMGFLSVLPILSMMWFLICMANMSAPPTLNLFSEILLTIFIFNVSHVVWPWLFLMVFLSVAYTLILYTAPHQSQPNFLMVTVFPLTLRELNLLTLHIMLAFSLLVYMNLLL